MAADQDAPVVRVDRQPDPRPLGSRPVRATASSAGLVVALFAAGFLAGTGVSALRQSQQARDEQAARDDVVRLGAVLLRQDRDDEVVELVVQLQNRGPATVRPISVTVPGTPLAGTVDRALPAGGDLQVPLRAPLGCTETGSSVRLPDPATALVTVDTPSGRRATVPVQVPRPPILDRYGTVDTTSLDRACGVVPAEQAVTAEAVTGASGTDAPTRPTVTPTGTIVTLAVRVDNHSVLPQRVLRLETPLGTATVERDGEPLRLPLTLLGVSAPTLGTNAVRAQTWFTAVVTCVPQLAAGTAPTVFLTFDAGPGTARQQTVVQGTTGAC